TIGPLVKLWKIGFAGANVPSKDAIEKKLSLIDPNLVEINDQDQTIFLTKKGMQLDLGAIAKGYIADRVADLWKALGVESGIINLGGNLLMVGPAPNHEDKKWRIGIQDPFAQRGQAIAAVCLGPCSAVTSGIYERKLQVGDHSYHHILDPKTGYPHDNDLAGVTIFSKESTVAEIETTRFFFKNADLEAFNAHQSEVYGAIFVTKDKKLRCLGFKKEDLTILNPAYSFE
ncbi:MAG: FAD:protein FMN transferase, partial [Ligilactobacillus agilis]|nr:FAD:protein FMN transferase [Ligilactobacillus agilis]